MADAQQYRLTGPHGRMIQDVESKTWSLVPYAAGDAITPTQDELDAHPDRFEAWPPSGTVLAETRPTEETPPEEPPLTSARSRR